MTITDPIDTAPILEVDDSDIRMKLWAVMRASERAGAGQAEADLIASEQAGELLALIADSQKKAAS